VTSAPTDYRASVLSLLATGPMSRKQLATAMGIRSTNADLDRTLQALVRDRKALRLPHEPGSVALFQLAGA
jgi:hypothetical protein